MESPYTTWNVTGRDKAGGVRAEFVIHANTAATALRETARNLAGPAGTYVAKIELVKVPGRVG